mmetsp:Transcript_22587/g.68886  ORF Transcript_22587/g.68886 Transcript_22587/m.68886 type:complete len:202 (-) Transcript_22587:549-1154(-)
MAAVPLPLGEKSIDSNRCMIAMRVATTCCATRTSAGCDWLPEVPVSSSASSLVPKAAVSSDRVGVDTPPTFLPADGLAPSVLNLAMGGASAAALTPLLAAARLPESFEAGRGCGDVALLDSVVSFALVAFTASSVVPVAFSGSSAPFRFSTAPAALALAAFSWSFGGLMSHVSSTIVRSIALPLEASGAPSLPFTSSTSRK